MDFKAVMKQFDHLAKDQLIKAFLEAGILTHAQLESAPKQIKAIGLLKERKELEERIEKLEDSLAEVKTKLVTACTHKFGETRVSDDHDGWSRGPYTQTSRKTCEICGHTDTEMRACTY